MEAQDIHGLLKRAQEITEERATLHKQLSDKDEALEKMEKELEKVKGEVRGLETQTKAETDELKRALVEAVEERDALKGKLTMFERALAGIFKMQAPDTAQQPSSSVQFQAQGGIESEPQTDLLGDGEPQDSQDATSPQSQLMVEVGQPQPEHNADQFTPDPVNPVNADPPAPNQSSSTGTNVASPAPTTSKPASRPSPDIMDGVHERDGENTNSDATSQAEPMDWDEGNPGPLDLSIAGPSSSSVMIPAPLATTTPGRRSPRMASGNERMMSGEEGAVSQAVRVPMRHGVDPANPQRCICGRVQEGGARSFQMHLDYYAGKRDQRCHVCGKLLKGGHLKRHMNVHNGCDRKAPSVKKVSGGSPSTRLPPTKQSRPTDAYEVEPGGTAVLLVEHAYSHGGYGLTHLAAPIMRVDQGNPVLAFHYTKTLLWFCKCGKDFVNLSDLNEHVTTGIINEGRRMFICSICQATFGLLADLKAHLKERHTKKGE